MNKAPGATYPTPHTHEFIEIAYVYEGNGTHYLDGQEHHVTKGDLFIINNHVPHYFIADPVKKEQMANYNLVFMPDFLDDTLQNQPAFSEIAKYWLYNSFLTEDITESRIQFTGNDAVRIEKLLQEMLMEFNAKEKGYEGMLKAYTLQLFFTLFRVYEKNNVYNKATVGQQNKLIDEIITYLDNHYDTSVQINDIAGHLFTSKSTLCKTFKDCTGMTITDYLQRTRMNNAAKLLSSSNRKVIDIANTIGYTDIKYFNKLFRKIMGMSPTQYRNTK